ncbi:MAG: T9SS type A sorting domain-containing protein [Flavobacteriales bacterium]
MEPTGRGKLDPSNQTVSINCRSNTNFYYLSVVGVSCGISYRLSYTVTPPIFANDAEPNDGSTTAIVLPHSTPTDGQINFSTYVENSDYYRLDLPSNGILNINWQAEHASATPGTATITLRANSTAALQSWTVAVGANSIPVSEALSMNCRGNQNFYYLSVVGVSCGISYRLSYTVTPPIYAIDPPTGTGTATAAVMRVDSASMQGQLNFFYGQANAYYRVYHQGGPLVLSALAEHAGASAANYTVVLRAVSTATLQTEVRSAGGSSAPLAATIDFGTRPAATYYVEVLNTPCGMSYAFNCDDADGDGVCNYYDLCANTPTGEGVNTNGCSCSQVVIDDGDVCTLDECLNGDVTHTFQDADNDLTCDANDGCPNDPNKVAPGQCGCGVADTDSDGDLTADCNDGCPNDPNKIAPGICGCGVSDVDSDGDLTADCNDGCPNDPNKIAPGICGCGVADMDSDGDLTADCNDGCPNDPNKTAPGNCGCGNPEPGANCDDGNANTTGDVILANCTCQGTPIGATDCNGVIGGPAQPGTPCDDLDACTVNDVYTGAFPNCGCAGTFADADNDGTCDANDGCPNDPNKVAPGNCGCGNPEPGASCDDGNANTVGDVIQANCTCAGTPIGGCDNEILLEFQNATNPGQVTWEVLDEGGTITVDSGTDVFPANTTAAQPICLADGCYRLRITDAAGDGLTGYELRESGMNGRRIIDNTGNSIAGTSAIANGGTFCLPIGDIDLISSNCDKQDWVNYQYLVCHADAAVSAVWVPNGSNNVQNGGTGYAFWIFDPNGSYSFRRFHAHNTSDGFSPASATRAAHLKINGWNNTALTPHIPADVLMNVRVRPVVMGSLGEWGATCTMKIDPVAAACPRVHLQDDPAFSGDYSCGVTREFGGSNRNANKLTAKPPQFQPAPLAGGTGVRYQFRFRLPSEGFCVVRPPQTSPRLFLNWNTDSAPVLEAGKTYEVEVRVSKDQGASWCVDAASPACDPNPVTTWGKVCNVTISGVAMLDAGGSDIAADNNGTLAMYPNPNNGEQLFISLTELTPEVSTVSVDIHDLTGKRITARTIAVQDGFLNTALSLNDDVASGVYVVSITAGDKAYTERLVIQK